MTRAGAAGARVDPDRVLAALRGHLQVDGLDLVLDLQASHGSTLVDARDGRAYLDLFSFYASNALGMNHPRFTEEVTRHLGRVAVNKPSNSDVYTAELARWVEVFEQVLGDPRLPHYFFIEGGAPAVENALKAAFDYKSRCNEAAGRDPARGTRVLHLTGAFHGRSGYTMSLTNTDPRKTDRFPKFDWPRIEAPAQRFPLAAFAQANARAQQRALEQAEAAFAEHGHDIACFVAEPIQGEGGDNHLPAGFLRRMQELCHANDALFVLDEVQTGVGLTGSAWCYQQLELEPDLVAFGKKTHVCGVMSGGRLDQIDDHVWRTPGRINSTFGGNLVDMVRATTVLEVIRDEQLIPRAAALGRDLLDALTGLAERHDRVTNVRGRGLMCAFDLPDAAMRDEVLRRLRQRERVLLLGCGTRSIRLRPALTVSADELDRGGDAIDRVLSSL